MSIFEQAAKIKLRYVCFIGTLNTEDLWDLDLKTLDGVAKSIHKKLKESEEVSFIEESSNADYKLQLQLDILKHIIKYKLDQQERIKNERAIKAHEQKLLGLIQEKENEEYLGKSKQELEAELAELKNKQK